MKKVFFALITSVLAFVSCGLNDDIVFLDPELNGPDAQISMRPGRILMPEYEGKGEVVFVSSDESVASVSGDMIIAVADGDAVITGTRGKKEASFVVHVYSIEVTSASCNNYTSTMLVGNTKLTEITATCSAASNPNALDMKWETSSSCVSLSANVEGIYITGVSAGTATVTGYSYAGKKLITLTANVREGVSLEGTKWYLSRDSYDNADGKRDGTALLFTSDIDAVIVSAEDGSSSRVSADYQYLPPKLTISFMYWGTTFSATCTVEGDRITEVRPGDGQVDYYDREY